MRSLWGQASVATAIFVAVAVSRVPFATTHLWAWDSGLYARALEQGFYVTADPATQRPHPPGYIWYVALAAIARAVVHDSNTALVIVSVASAAAGAAILFLIASRYVRRPVALVVAAAYAASPLVWTYSEVAYPYTLLALLSLILGWWLIEGDRPVLESLVIGIAAGFRQDLILLVGPLWLWRVSRHGARTTAQATLALGVGTLSWAIPSAILSGGASAYARALLEQSGKVTAGAPPATGADALALNVVLEGEPLLAGLTVLWIVLVADGAWGLWQMARGRGRRPSGLAVGLALWVVPALLFYTVVHIGEWGYVLSVVPPLMLAAAVRIDRVITRLPSRAWPAVALIAVLVPAALFIAGDTRFSLGQLRERDRANGPLTQCCPTIVSGWE